MGANVQKKDAMWATRRRRVFYNGKWREFDVTVTVDLDKITSYANNLGGRAIEKGSATCAFGAVKIKAKEIA